MVLKAFAEHYNNNQILMFALYTKDIHGEFIFKVDTKHGRNLVTWAQR